MDYGMLLVIVEIVLILYCNHYDNQFDGLVMNYCFAVAVAVAIVKRYLRPIIRKCC